MRISIIILAMLLIPTFAMAKDGEKIWLRGFYGLNFISPSDINGKDSSVAGNPKPSSISQGTEYGATLNYNLSQKISLGFTYEAYAASNSTSNSSGTVGYDLTQTEGWVTLNYMLTPMGKPGFIYIGGGLGYPLTCQVVQKLPAQTTFTGDSTIAYRGQLGVGTHLGKSFLIYAEGGYDYMVSGNLKNGGTTLTKAGGGNAVMDLSGLRALAGLGFAF